MSAGDRMALAALEAAFLDARAAGDRRPALVVLATALAELGVTAQAPQASRSLVARGRDDWLRRLRSGGRSDSTFRAYRHALALGRAVLERIAAQLGHETIGS